MCKTLPPRLPCSLSVCTPFTFSNALRSFQRRRQDTHEFPVCLQKSRQSNPIFPARTGGITCGLRSGSVLSRVCCCVQPVCPCVSTRVFARRLEDVLKALRASVACARCARAYSDHAQKRTLRWLTTGQRAALLYESHFPLPLVSDCRMSRRAMHGCIAGGTAAAYWLLVAVRLAEWNGSRW